MGGAVSLALAISQQYSDKSCVCLLLTKKSLGINYNDVTLPCQAFLQGIYGRKFVWLLPGWYSDRWWGNSVDTSCTKHDIKLAAGNYLATRPIPLGDSTTLTIAGKVSNGFPLLEEKRIGLFLWLGLIRLFVTRNTRCPNESALL